MLKRMIRQLAFMLAAVIVFSGGNQGQTVEPKMTVCELSRDFTIYRDQRVSVRGVYYYGLRQTCSQKCTGVGVVWPSFINLQGGDNRTWAALEEASRRTESQAKQTKRRYEVWVTITGRLKTFAGRSFLGPCDIRGWGTFGHLGQFPAQIDVESIGDIHVKENPGSPYDYGNMYHGPL
jgi:hypothetical protein